MSTDNLAPSTCSQHCYRIRIYKERPKKQNLFIKNCLFILTCLNFSHLQSTLHLIQCTCRDIFHCSKHLLNSSILMPLSTSVIFRFASSTLAKFFPLRNFFHWGNKQKSLLGQDLVNRKGGAWGSCRFWSKPPEHSGSAGRCTCKSPIMKWANALKKPSKNKFTEAEHSLSQQCQLVH